MRVFLSKSTELFSSVIKDSLTGKDGTSYDVGKVIWALGTMVFLSGAIRNMFLSVPFDYTAFGIGFGAVMAAGAASVKIKETTEPDVK